MRLKIDHQADALYLSLSEVPASRSEEVSPGIIVDCDAHDRVGASRCSISRSERRVPTSIGYCSNRSPTRAEGPGKRMARTTIDHLIINSP